MKGPDNRNGNGFTGDAGALIAYTKVYGARQTFCPTNCPHLLGLVRILVVGLIGQRVEIFVALKVLRQTLPKPRISLGKPLSPNIACLGGSNPNAPWDCRNLDRENAWMLLRAIFKKMTITACIPVVMKNRSEMSAISVIHKLLHENGR